MPGIIVDGVVAEEAPNEVNSSQNKENLSTPRSPVASKSMHSEALEMHVEGSGAGEPSIEQLYNNVCEMESSSEGGSPSRESFGSDGEESRIDSELRHLVAGEMEAMKVIEEEEEGGESVAIAAPTIENGTPVKTQSSSSSKKSKKAAKSQLESDASIGPNGKASPQEGESEVSKTASRVGRRRKASANPPNGTEDAGLNNPDLGPFLLKHARDLIASDNPRRALKYALRATKSFEKCAGGKPSLNLVMSLHVVAAIYCNLGKYEEAVPVLQRSLEIPVIEEGLKIQKQTLGEQDPRVGETCRYLAEAHVQALQLDEAQLLCQTALDIHRENGEPASLEETADRRLMGLICDTKGDHEAALEHLMMASMAMVANGQETEVASVDCSIGDIYLSLGRYDEAVFAYQKALTVFKTSKGENHAMVASVFVRLADLYNKTGKLRESKSYCENALRIYQKPIPGTSLEEIATGLTDVSAIYETMNEHEQALKLLQKALKMYDNSAGQQSTIAGIEAQMGVLHYILGNYGEAYDSFKSAIAKLRTCGEKKTAFFGVALNQMGLACVQRYSINEAAELFEEARAVLEQEYGPYHPDTLGVYSNLAGTYDAMGRLHEAIEILEYVVGMREEKLGTANPDVDDEKRRLAELLKEAGRVYQIGWFRFGERGLFTAPMEVSTASVLYAAELMYEEHEADPLPK
ncbi:hypothetical protein GUJ93_ZPchr0006g45424 [Zizania palustris]|uniref:Ancillary SecYEG translocon subunit/Cell division coordinator CpoB TPR domain-containing protein n=1 Tax=Zizania palustris TaxID=103762 RepID=A0A8J5W203_ZIZPA|nr:hypothetical protein GUJ93_ZPchr0006g45424 [Zizania palustris]